MLRANFILAGVLAVAAVGNAGAQVTVHVLGVGSSALFNTSMYGAWKNLAGGSSSGHHYTIKGSCATLGNCAQANDVRTGAGVTSIPPQGGNLAVVWDGSASNVWVYLSVDSVVGNRMFFATPTAQLQVDPGVIAGCTSGCATPGNLISSGLWGNDDPSVPTAVYNAINNAAFTAAFTDIRPEDALFATNRALAPLNTTNYAGLGYGPGPVGALIKSAFSSSSAQPVSFALTGTDPITGQAVLGGAGYTTVSVGASPILFIVNKTNTTAGHLGDPNFAGTGVPLSNVTFAQLQNLFSELPSPHGPGLTCNTSALGGSANPPIPVNTIQREPISGTMNTTEFNVFRKRSSPNACTSSAPGTCSQETEVDPSMPQYNPLNTFCVGPAGEPQGNRYRAIGTSELVGTGVLNTADSISYTFFSYGNVSKIAGSANYGYLKLNGIDPIAPTYTNGELPTCTAPCPATSLTFPNLRSGRYEAWSILRAVSATGSQQLTDLQTLVSNIESVIDVSVPDFVPAVPVGKDPGLKLYRSHFSPNGVVYPTGKPSNGFLLGGGTCTPEIGGDVGGRIYPTSQACPGVLNARE